MLTAPTSFVALRLITNSAIATPIVHSAFSQAESPAISLNVANLVLQLVGDRDDRFLHSLGCCCDACTQSNISVNQSAIL